MKNISERLQYVMAEKKFSQKDLAARLDVDVARVSDWCTGKVKSPRDKNITQICKILECDFWWLKKGGGEPFPKKDDHVAVKNNPPIGAPESNSKLVKLIQIPVLGKVPAGIPATLEEFDGEYISLPNAPENCYALKVSGESMEPTFRHNDYVLFVIDQDIKSNDVVIVNDEFGESMVKRYKEKDGEIKLVSDNPLYPTITPNGDYRTMGKVVGAWRQLNI